STNHDIYEVNVETGERRQVTTNSAADGLPRYSPDGKHLAYRAQARPGFEADRWQLFLYDRASGARRSVTPEFDAGVDNFTWAPDSQTLFIESEEHGRKPIWSVSSAGGEVKRVFARGVNGDVAVLPGRE